MSTGMGDLLMVLVLPPLTAVMWAVRDHIQGRPWRLMFWPGWSGAGFTLLVVSAAYQDWPAAAVSAGQCALGVWMFWRNRRKDRRDALGAIGYKARALLDALVRRAREATAPRPLLRPVPGGAQ